MSLSNSARRINALARYLEGTEREDGIPRYSRARARARLDPPRFWCQGKSSVASSRITPRARSPEKRRSVFARRTRLLKLLIGTQREYESEKRRRTRRREGRGGGEPADKHTCVATETRTGVFIIRRGREREREEPTNKSTRERLEFRSRLGGMQRNEGIRRCAFNIHFRTRSTMTFVPRGAARCDCTSGAMHGEPRRGAQKLDRR